MRTKRVLSMVFVCSRSLFGTVRRPRELYSSREQQRNVSQVDIHQRIFTMSKYVSTSPGTEPD